MEVVLFLICYY